MSRNEAESLVTQTLMANRTSKANARLTAKALVAAEIDGQHGHGLSRVSSYALQARAGKVNGFAEPALTRLTPTSVRIDAHYGFAYPAIELAVNELVPITKEFGIGVASIFRSHHFGQAGAHVERLAKAGLIGLLFGNSPAAMAFWGGKKPMMGTNPIAFAAPCNKSAPLVIDLALSKVARGKIVAAKNSGQKIAEGLALDSQGHATTDPAAALAGSMLPIGEVKGAALALMVEILAAALTGAHFGFEASSLFDDEGGPPNLGHTMLAIDPIRLSGGQYFDRMAVLFSAIENEQGARLPGSRRLHQRDLCASSGIVISSSLHREIVSLASPAN
ncbi:MAG: Ldh family oxidoreductase [Xanthomonadales bacterium]|nr:Ldh family oxidoreductase [Xanthomonadales bacterium]